MGREEARQHLRRGALGDGLAGQGAPRKVRGWACWELKRKVLGPMLGVHWPNLLLGLLATGKPQSRISEGGGGGWVGYRPQTRFTPVREGNAGLELELRSLRCGQGCHQNEHPPVHRAPRSMLTRPFDSDWVPLWGGGRWGAPPPELDAGRGAGAGVGAVAAAVPLAVRRSRPP